MSRTPRTPRTPSRRLFARALAATTLTTALLGLPVPEAAASSLPSRCRTGRVVCLDKTARTLRWVVDGRVKLTLSARFGASRTPTREGSFRIYWKDVDHVSSLFGSAMPFSMFFSGGQAVHYSSDFARVGYNGASHGCVNLRSWSGARSLYNSARVGDRVYVYRSG